MNQDNFLWGLQITDGLTMELVSQMTVIAFGVGVICLSLIHIYKGDIDLAILRCAQIILLVKQERHSPEQTLSI